MRPDVLLLVGAIILSAGCEVMLMGGQFGLPCAYGADLDMRATAAGVARVRIVARAGSLRVEGQADAPDVHAFGPACARSQADLDGIELVTRQTGDELLIETRFAEGGRLDLTVQLPHTLPVEVDDTSGSVRVTGVAGANIRDRSGSLRVTGIRGDVRVTDGSGSLRIHDVDGTVVIENDGAGSIDVREVTGDVVVEEDGSGSITVTDVQGEFTVVRDGSGGIHAERVQGNPTVVPSPPIRLPGRSAERPGTSARPAAGR